MFVLYHLSANSTNQPPARIVFGGSVFGKRLWGHSTLTGRQKSVASRCAHVTSKKYPPGTQVPSNRADHKESEATSPPARVPRARQTLRSTYSLMERTEPSISVTFTTPG